MQPELNHPRPSIRIMCPKCNAIAKLKLIQPRMFTPGVSNAIYMCGKCGTETRRKILMENYRG